jgi:hypothetical protein
VRLSLWAWLATVTGYVAETPTVPTGAGEGAGARGSRAVSGTRRWASVVIDGPKLHRYCSVRRSVRSMAVAALGECHDSVEGSSHQVAVLNLVTECRLQSLEVTPLCFFLR